MGIVGGPGDPQVASVAAFLEGQGKRPLVLDLGSFPGQSTLSLVDGVPVGPGGEPLRQQAWYLRSMPLSVPILEAGVGAAGESRPPGERTDARIRYAVQREIRSFAGGFVRALARRGAKLVNPAATLQQHFFKTDQLDRMRAAGVPVPRTLATNDPDAVLAFAETHGGRIVYKPLAGGGLCRRVKPADLGECRLTLLAHAPVLFQEEVEGRNIRVYVVDGVVAACFEIVSEELDFRGAEQAVLAVEATDVEEEAACGAVGACGMAFSGVDIRRRPDGSSVALECNPSPMFAAIERRVGSIAVTEALGRLLIRSACATLDA